MTSLIVIAIQLLLLRNRRCAVGQVNNKRSALRVLAIDINLSAQFFDGVLHNVQPKARSIRLHTGAIKHIKYLRKVGRLNAYAIVAESNLCLVFSDAYAYDDLRIGSVKIAIL